MTLHDLTKFSTLTLALYRLAHELPVDQFQDGALRLIKPHVPFDASMWGTAGTAPEGVDVHTLHLFEKTPEMMVEYVPMKQLDTAAAAMCRMPRATRGFHSSTWWGRAEDREFLAYLQRYRQNNILITSEHDAQRHFLRWISLFREDPDAHCKPEEEDLLRQLSPHLMQALALNRMLHLNSLDAGDPRQREMAIADPRGVLYHATPGFIELMHGEWGGAVGRRMPPALLQHFLDGHERFAGKTLVVHRRATQGLLFLAARARVPADALTVRERLVAQLVCRGDTHKQVAQVLGRSPATVRNQIQAIYDKLDVRNVAQLILELRLAE